MTGRPPAPGTSSGRPLRLGFGTHNLFRRNGATNSTSHGMRMWETAWGNRFLSSIFTSIEGIDPRIESSGNRAIGDRFARADDGRDHDGGRTSGLSIAVPRTISDRTIALAMHMG